MGIVVDAAHSFSETRAADAAASIAYYALLSLFPLLFFVVAIGHCLSSKILKFSSRCSSFVTEALPTAKELVQQNIEHMLDIRGTIGLAGTIGLLWSATAVFTVLASNVNRAWRDAGARNFLKRASGSLGMVGSLLGIVIDPVAVPDYPIQPLTPVEYAPLRGCFNL